MIPVLAVVAGALMVAFTLKVVAGRMLRIRRQMKTLAEVRDVVDAIAREVAAGARPLEAVEHAAEGLKSEALRHELDVACVKVRLGAAPGAGSGGAAPGEGTGGTAPGSDAPSSLAHLFHIWGISHRHGVGLAAPAAP